MTKNFTIEFTKCITRNDLLRREFTPIRIYEQHEKRQLACNIFFHRSIYLSIQALLTATCLRERL